MKLSELSKFGSESLSGVKILLQSKEAIEKEEASKLNTTYVSMKTEKESRTAAGVKLTRSMQRKMQAAQSFMDMQHSTER
jgi:hypothetical protein